MLHVVPHSIHKNAHQQKLFLKEFLKNYCLVIAVLALLNHHIYHAILTNISVPSTLCMWQAHKVYYAISALFV